jgi:hypothetical protein
VSSFTAKAEFDYDSRSGLYINRHAFRFYFSDDKTGAFVDVPAGFKSNGASIPRPIQNLFGWKPMDARWAQAAFIHDGLVAESGVQLYIGGRIPSWKEAADWFDKALSVKQAQMADCPKLNRVLFVKAVKVWGIMR